MINRLFHAAAWIINRLPRLWALALGRLLGAGLYLVMPYRKDVAWNNLSLALPERSRRQRWAILHRTYQHFGMMLTDFIRMPNLTTHTLGAMIDFDESYIQEVRDQGSGAVVISGHIGNWELFVPALGLRGYPITPVMVTQRGAGGSFVTEVRDNTSHQYISKKTSTRIMLQRLKAGTFLLLAGDQDARKRGVWVTLLGQPSSRPRGGAVFALKASAPLLVGCCLLKKDRRYRLSLRPISTADLPQNRDQAIQILTQRYTDALGEAIQKHPEQYFWFHRMWKSHPEPAEGTSPEPAEGTRPTQHRRTRPARQ
ncbi:MAG: lysophospholipid acyltransferase family protein [Candidatus Neomarinimicrobiota bacterium]